MIEFVKSHYVAVLGIVSFFGIDIVIIIGLYLLNKYRLSKKK